ncbi:MAG TPA: hypothetical protein VM283_03425 [Armatimonadota bacterium]|nr:hypothetical protein [Armatimonadota bacterium]
MRGITLVKVCSAVVIAVVIAGCSSEYWYDDTNYWDDGGSVQKTVRIYLNVADQDGEALRNATVWIDGTQQEDKTEGEYRALGNNFPPGWRGWLYNWKDGPFWYDVRDYSGAVTIEVMVSKSGYRSQRTTLRFTRSDPDDIYARQTFVMDRAAGTAEVVEAAQAPEMISAKQLTQ